MSYKLVCPVPKKQRPINEYIELAQSEFFDWPTKKTFFQTLLKVFGSFFALFFPFFLLVSTNHPPLEKLILLNLGCSGLCVFLMVVRLLLAWTYIQNRLSQSSIFYEESGWYDGRVWVKSRSILVQDRFIHRYQVVPILKTLKKTLKFGTAFLGSWFLLFILQ